MLHRKLTVAVHLFCSRKNQHTSDKYLPWALGLLPRPSTKYPRRVGGPVAHSRAKTARAPHASLYARASHLDHDITPTPRFLRPGNLLRVRRPALAQRRPGRGQVPRGGVAGGRLGDQARSVPIEVARVSRVGDEAAAGERACLQCVQVLQVLQMFWDPGRDMQHAGSWRAWVRPGTCCTAIALGMGTIDAWQRSTSWFYRRYPVLAVPFFELHTMTACCGRTTEAAGGGVYLC